MNQFLRNTALLVAALLLTCSGCALPESAQTNTQLHKIVGTDRDRHFVDARGDRFFPWGLNYTNPETIGLVDDDLYAANTWQVIEEDFAEMKQYSANTVRIHLQYHRFMRGPKEPDFQAFAALKQLLHIAEKNRLYLIVTGLGAYRKMDTPAWYDALGTQQRWATQALFWRTMAKTLKASDAVFAYDLMNEPVVSVCPNGNESCEWVVGQPMGGLHFVQNISIEPGVSYSATVKAWIKRLTRAIRSEDKRTLITLGNLDLISVTAFQNDLDFVSKHIYPRGESYEQSAKAILSAKLKRPLVLEEIFNLYCSVDELGKFLDSIEGSYHGLIGHYFGDTLEELSSCTKLSSRLKLDFIEFFIARNPNRMTAEPANVVE